MKGTIYNEKNRVYGYCLGQGSRHFRLLHGEHEGKQLCQQCLMLKYRTGVLFQSESTVEIMQDSLPVEAPIQSKRRSRVKLTSRKARKNTVRRLIGRLLNTGYYTREDLYQKVKHIAISFAQVEDILLKMRRSGKLFCLQIGSRGKKLYTANSLAEKLKQYTGTMLQDDLLNWIGDTDISVNELADKTGRPSVTVRRWVENLEREGKIVCVVRKQPTGKGRAKYCRRPPIS